MKFTFTIYYNCYITHMRFETQLNHEIKSNIPYDWAFVSDYYSKSNDLKTYFLPHHMDIQPDSYLTNLYFRSINSDNMDQASDEILAQYWTEHFMYTDRNGNVRYRVCSIRKSSKLYHINVLYRRLVDYCYTKQFVVNNRPLIGPHNYDALKAWIYSCNADTPLSFG